jgi:hypothetical protein
VPPYLHSTLHTSQNNVALILLQPAESYLHGPLWLRLQIFLKISRIFLCY